MTSLSLFGFLGWDWVSGVGWLVGWLGCPSGVCETCNEDFIFELRDEDGQMDGRIGMVWYGMV